MALVVYGAQPRYGNGSACHEFQETLEGPVQLWEQFSDESRQLAVGNMGKNAGYNIYEAKTRLSELVDKAKRGEKVILMNRGESDSSRGKAGC